MSVLAWATLILVVWLVVGFLVAIPLCRFIRAGEGVPFRSSHEAAAQAKASTLRVVGEEHPKRRTAKSGTEKPDQSERACLSLG
jgi:hypothetical protein